MLQDLALQLVTDYCACPILISIHSTDTIGASAPPLAVPATHASLVSRLTDSKAMSMSAALAYPPHLTTGSADSLLTFDIASSLQSLQQLGAPGKLHMLSCPCPPLPFMLYRALPRPVLFALLLLSDVSVPITGPGVFRR